MISTLIERLEKAAGADASIDNDLRIHFGYPPKPWNYTQSVAALGLVERVLPGQWVAMLDDAQANMWQESAPDMHLDRLPRAICLATLRALKHREEGK